MGSSIDVYKRQMQHRLRHVFLDHAFGHLQARGDLEVGVALEVRQQEGGASLGVELVEQRVELAQGVQQQRAFLGRGRQGVGHGGEGVAVGAFQVLAPPVVHHQAMGDGGEVGARFADRFEVAQHPQEGVVRQVGGVEGIAQAAAQPVLQPAVVVAVEDFDIRGCRARGGEHDGDAANVE